jgi:hypothetical protein
MGEIERQWPRLAPDVVAIEAFVRSLEDRVAGRAPLLRPAPRVASPDLLLEWAIPDHHVGMRSWAQETGADYDLAIASDLLTGGAELLAERVGPVARAVIVVLGDYYHVDLQTAQTERGGHVLDVDGRAHKRIDAGVAALCSSIERIATIARTVEVVVIPGNHDTMSSVWLSRVLAAYYSHHIDAKRISIRTDAAPHQVVHWGQVALLYGHGDKASMSKLARLFPAKWPKIWAASTHRRIRIGHWHTKACEEYPGVTAETLSSLVAPDAYAANGAYMSERLITATVWSARHGMRSRLEFGPAEISARRRSAA